MRYSLLAPGKRLRPFLVIMGCQIAGGNEKLAMPAACAIEMVHTYSLVHDDLPAMDDDDLRRGLPTCHKQFGEAMAILVGDALLTLAFSLIAESYPARTVAVSCKELAIGAGAKGMVGGQVLDLMQDGKIAAMENPVSEDEPSGSLKYLEGIHSRKTGALFRAAPKLGLYAAQAERPDGPDPILSDRLDAYGRAFGLAFQIADDLLDVEGTSEATGKRVGKDADRGKLTYPGLLGVAESRRRAEEIVSNAVEGIKAYGESAQPLVELARYVVKRKR
jgi:geranylgeranyl diphosphate synthase type II